MSSDLTNIFNFIIILGGIQGLILAYFLITNDGKNRKSNVWMSIFLATFSINSIYFSIEGLGYRNGDLSTVLDFLPLNFSNLIIASFFYFVLHLLEDDQSKDERRWMFLIPYAFQLVVQLFWFLGYFLFKDYLWDNIRWIIDVFSLIDLYTVIFGLYVIVSSLIKLRHYEKNLLNNYADISKHSLSWLNKLILGLFGIWIIWTIPTIYEIFLNRPSVNIFYPLGISMSILVYCLGYASYFKRDVFGAKMFYKENIEPVTSKKLSTKTDAYYENLLSEMENKKLFLNPDLNLKTLSENLNISSGYLSQIINQNSGHNFFDFVNNFRINYFKEKVNDTKYEHLSLLGLAFECGFNSKSTFNLAFKKLTGKTPSSFRKKS